MTVISMRSLASALVLSAIGLPALAGADVVYGLTTRDQLVRFDSSTPGSLAQASFISGLMSNESLVGIDFRPANGMLYGLGSFGNLYTLSTATAAATFRVNIGVQLSGVEFGVDFNPVADRLRITSDQDQNLRVNVDTGATTIDGTLTNSGGGNPNIVASAYLNNDNVPNTGTTLYNIDSASNMLTIQNPPNAGTQANVGGLGIEATALAGFDIVTAAGQNRAWAAMQPFGSAGSGFYSVNLATGGVTFVGGIGNSQTSDSLAIRDIAAVPEPATMIALAIGALGLARRRKARIS